MLENRVKETGCDYKASEPDRLSQQAWAPEIIAAPDKKSEKLVTHLEIGKRCVLNEYEHHWELIMPRVDVPFSISEKKVGTDGMPKLIVKDFETTVTHDRLIMDDKGIWTIKDEKGECLEQIKQKNVLLPADANDPEKLTEYKLKVYDEKGTRVLIDQAGKMTFIRHQAHNYENPEGTPEYDKEFAEHLFVVDFNKSDGVLRVTDEGTTWDINRTGKKP